MRTRSSTLSSLTLLVLAIGPLAGCGGVDPNSPGLGSGSGENYNPGGGRGGGPSFTVTSPGFANTSQLTMTRGETLRFEVYLQYQDGHEKLTDDPISVSLAENPGEPHDPELWLQDVTPRTLTNQPMATVTIVAGANARVDFHSLRFQWQCKHWQSWSQVNLEVFDRAPGWQPVDGSIAHNATPRSPALAGSATRLFAAVAERRQFVVSGETTSAAAAPIYATATRQGFTTLEPLVEHTPRVDGDNLSQPKLAVAPNGTLYASRYYVNYKGDQELRLDRLTGGGDNTLDPVTTFPIANNQGSVFDSALAVGDDGRVWLAWNLSRRVYVAYLGDDGMLSLPAQVGSDQGEEVVELALVGGPQPQVVIAAENDDGEATVRVFALAASGATLRGTIGGAAPEIRALAAAIAPDGTLLVSYQTVAENLAGLHVYSLAAGSDANTATEVPLPTAIASREVTQTSLAIDDTGARWFAAIDRFSRQRTILALLPGSDMAWTPRETGSALDLNTHELVLATGLGGVVRLGVSDGTPIFAQGAGGLAVYRP